MTGVAPAGAHRSMKGHARHVGRKACSRIGMAGAALNSRDRDVRRGQAGRIRAVVATQASRNAWRVDESSAPPAREG